MEEQWYKINAPKPIDGHHYNIKLKDGKIYENVEFWAFKNVFISAKNIEIKVRDVEEFQYLRGVDNV